MNLEQTKKPAFYPDDNTIATLTMPYAKESVLRVPSGQRKTFEVTEEGIVESLETIDQFGESMYAGQKMVMSKDAFIAAYNAYIKGE